MGENYRVREVTKPQTYKPKTLELEEAPFSQTETKADIKSRISTMLSDSAALPPKKPVVAKNKQPTSVLVGYARETDASGSEISREALLYLNFVEKKDKNNHPEIAWNESGYTLKIIDYDQQHVKQTTKQLSTQRKTVSSYRASQKTAAVTEYTFDIYGLHTTGYGIMTLENIDENSRPTQQDVVPLEKIMRNITNPKDIKCALSNDRYANTHPLADNTQLHKVFALALTGPDRNTKNYAVTPLDTLNYAYPPQQVFMGMSEPINIYAYVKSLRNQKK